MNQLKEKHRRTKLPNTVSIDSIYERNFLSLSSVLETVIVDAFSLPGNVYLEVYLILIVHEEDHEIVLLHEQCVLVAISNHSSLECCDKTCILISFILFSYVFFQVQIYTCLPWVIFGAPIPLIFIYTVGKLLNKDASTIGLAVIQLC